LTSDNGEWTPETAGGCRHNGTWRMNQQFRLWAKKTCYVTIILTQTPPEQDEEVCCVLVAGGVKGRIPSRIFYLMSFTCNFSHFSCENATKFLTFSYVN